MADTKNEVPKPQWVYRQEFVVNRQLRVVLKETIRAAQSQVEELRRKLKKMQYGS